VDDAQGRKVRDLAPIKTATVPVPGRTEMLEGFTGVAEDEKGTAYNVFRDFAPGEVAGKTGTAQVQGKQSTSWFVGMTPAAAPRFIVLAMVEEGGYGSGTAAPIVHRIMQGLTGKAPTNVVVSQPASGDT
jgi:penicillin-binding protein 2